MCNVFFSMDRFVIEFSFIKGEYPQDRGLACVFSVVQNQNQPVLDYLRQHAHYDTIIAPLVDTFEFSGKSNALVSTCDLSHGVNVILCGLGPKDGVDQEAIRKAAGLIYGRCLQLRVETLVVHLDDFLLDPSCLKAFVEGILLACHVDDRFKSKKDELRHLLKRVCFVNAVEDDKAIAWARHIVHGVILAKELVNGPANHVTPAKLAQTAQELASHYPLTAKILEREDCQKLDMGAYLSVTNGSDLPPKFIHLCYKPRQLDPSSRFKKIAIIGKGITFDSGGLNLKVGPARIEDMKDDMAGAAAVLGVADIVGSIQPNKEIHFIIAATENMINGKATRPGDIVTASNGKTIEIDNTDAEGRLTLADALVYAEKLDVDAIVDLATLTGAMIVALGERIAGLFGTDKGLSDELLEAGKRTGEQLWPMPLEASYFEESMQSVVADMRNAGDRNGGGSIVAAMFLKEFVDHTPWVHLDIAGPVAVKKPWFYHRAGATGFGVRLLADWILNH